MNWHHVHCGSAWKPGDPPSELFPIEVTTNNGSVIQLPALQLLRLRDGPTWRQGSSVHDTVYDADANDPDITGTGTLIGMFKTSGNAWRAVECVNLFHPLRLALPALLTENARLREQLRRHAVTCSNPTAGLEP